MLELKEVKRKKKQEQTSNKKRKEKEQTDAKRTEKKGQRETLQRARIK